MAKKKSKGGGDDDNLKKHLRKVAAKSEQRLDQNLARVRDEYKRMDAADRKELSGWVKKLAKLEDSGVVAGFARARVQFLIQEGHDVEEVVVSVRSLNKAVE